MLLLYIIILQIGGELMGIKVNSVSSVYMYKTNRKSWKNSGKANVYCLAYQTSGHYDHTFLFDVLTVKTDTLLLIAKNQP